MRGLVFIRNCKLYKRICNFHLDSKGVLSFHSILVITINLVTGRRIHRKLLEFLLSYKKKFCKTQICYWKVLFILWFLLRLQDKLFKHPCNLDYFIWCKEYNFKGQFYVCSKPLSHAIMMYKQICNFHIK